MSINMPHLVVYRQLNMRDPDGNIPQGTFVFEDLGTAKKLMKLLNEDFHCEALVGSPSN